MGLQYLTLNPPRCCLAMCSLPKVAIAGTTDLHMFGTRGAHRVRASFGTSFGASYEFRTDAGTGVYEHGHVHIISYTQAPRGQVEAGETWVYNA
jgi:hypothetical protein